MQGGRRGEKWLSRYLQRKGVSWRQVVSGSPFWYSAPFEAYNVRYLPMYLLLDRKGDLVAVDPRGDELDDAIERALALRSD